jgi:hypothetical protein
MDYNKVINRTIYSYHLEKQREFKKLKEDLKTCCCFPTRKKIKSRLEELEIILSRDYSLAKYQLVPVLGVSYKELKNYPELVEITNKQRILKRALA